MEVVNGDCLVELRKLEANSIDLVCTDPPYGYSFMGKDWDKAVPSVEIWQECLRVLKPGGFAFVMSAPRQDVLSQMIVRIGQAGFDTDFTSIYWTYASGFPKAQNMSKAIDKRLGAKREILGVSPNWRESKRDREKDGSMEVRGKNAGLELGPPVTSEAQALDGSYGGFQPKPAVEVVIVAMKPLSEKTFVAQALKNGKGVTWLDDCRVPCPQRQNPQYGAGGDLMAISKGGEQKWDGTKETVNGRFPANLLISDDVLNDGRQRTSGKMNGTYQGPSNYSQFAPTARTTIGDTGSYSRYFDLDAWWAKTFPFLIVPKASKREKNAGLERHNTVTVGDGRTKAIDNAFQRGKTERLNSHPTVKPLKLMSYLITLGSRKDDTVLDPFLGSGTTAVAAKMLGRMCVGIERQRDYAIIARARIAATAEPKPQLFAAE